MKALIAGGGIGGMVAALYLHRAGIDAEILERAEKIRELALQRTVIVSLPVSFVEEQANPKADTSQGSTSPATSTP
jgi:2-polyprenyl-6-methoxyphenol hydroxylase-like FAD-dependent oxidoreductase